ncbi:MAG: DUF2586 domain-containing protein [Dysgonamonadaceae bacterium]|jgi:hypothetical protein|nr:DUF2586 domain-containing protein [Dysgonamonadaceae bacterium]
MNTLIFERINGQVSRSLPGEDHISGLLYYKPDASYPQASAGTAGFSATNPVIAVSSIETAESLGIRSDAAAWWIRNLHYHLSEVFRINPGIALYLGLYAQNATFAEIKLMQNFSGGKIRQIGVWNGAMTPDVNHLTTLAGVASQLEAEDAPLIVLYSAKYTSPNPLSNVVQVGRNRLCLITGQDGGGRAAELYVDANNEGYTVGGVGIVLGLVSKAAVHESIGWVQKFPTGVDVPAFTSGTLYRAVDAAVIAEQDSFGHLFFRTYNGFGGSYMSDSKTLDLPTSDYATIESVRTMDKAVRGIRSYLLPYLSSPVYVNATTGKLRADTVKILEVTAGRALEDMEKAGELSGWVVEINPEQNVLATSALEIVIRNVAVGVLRTLKVKIGYATKL